MTDSFVRDIEPFFYERRVSYVDVGAHEGKVFRVFLESKLQLAEVHLVEPNPQSYKRLCATAETLKEGVSSQLRSKIVCHNVAIGESVDEAVQMRPGDTMTKVVNNVSQLNPLARQNLFEIKSLSLDELAKSFVHHHISILKIDVEGSEQKVLRGAAKLLEDQEIDVIYVEAGLDPDNPQQCYYRDIEDVLISYGYRIFKIYEQRHEWITDSPLLRRVNIAFMSRRFADHNPHKLTQELFAAKEARRHLESDVRRLADEVEGTRAELRRAEAAATAANAKVGEVDAEREAQSAQLATLTAQVERLQHQLDDGFQAQEVMRSELHNLRAELLRARTEKDQAEEYVEKLQRRIGKRDRRIAELRARILGLRTAKQQATENHKKAVDKLQGSVTYSLGRILVGVSKSPRKAVLAPRDVWREYKRLRRSAKRRNPSRDSVARTTTATSPSPQEKPKAAGDRALKQVPARTAKEVGRTASARRKKDQALLREVDLYARQGNEAEVSRLIEMMYDPTSTEVRYARANLRRENEALWLEHLNAVLAEYELSPLRLRPVAEAGSTSRIQRLEGSGAGTVDGPKVTIAMSCYNAASTVHMALRSLLQQTYSNLEIIAVNDCSSDETLPFLKEIEASDPRVAVRNNIANVGTYVSRNRCLYEAEGHYFTVMDSDDFAHPQRIEKQVEALQRSRDLVGVMTRWVRMAENGTFVFRRGWGGVYEHEAVATLMFRTEDVRRRIGFWDGVRFSADTEYMHRMRHVWGRSAVPLIRKACVIALYHNASLTSDPLTGVDLEKGLSPTRQNYRAAWEAWHKAAGPELYLPLSPSVRPFPAPPEML